MENSEIKSKKGLVILGSLIFLVGITLMGYNFYNYISEKEKIDDAIEEYYEEDPQEEIIEEIEEPKQEVKKQETSYDYIAILRIPKINLKRGLVAKESRYNNINYNIMIHSESDSPDDDGGNVILVAHSGSASMSYFRYSYKLNLGDKIYLDYNNKTYEYKIINQYDIEKTGQASIRKNTRKSSITLITCRSGTNKQIVLIGELIAQ